MASRFTSDLLVPEPASLKPSPISPPPSLVEPLAVSVVILRPWIPVLLLVLVRQHTDLGSDYPDLVRCESAKVLHESSGESAD